MKRFLSTILALTMILGLCACGPKAPTWQEQYDLGVKYLTEGNYEEAIIAFTAAIDIDPNRAEAYLSLAGVYLETGSYDEAMGVMNRGTGVMGTAGHEQELAEWYAAYAEKLFDQSDYERAVQAWMTAGEWSGDSRYQGRLDEANRALASSETASALRSSVWDAYYGSNQLYEFHGDGTGRILKNRLVDETPFTYQVEGNSVTIREQFWTYTWEYDAVKERFLWDIMSTGKIGTEYDEEDVDENGNLIVIAVEEDFVKRVKSPGEDAVDSMCDQIVRHYTDLWHPNGAYSCYSSEFEEDFDRYTFILRYMMSEAEMEERLARGAMPVANVYVTTVWINRVTGEATDEINEESWSLEIF